MKTFEVKERQIGENIFYIRPLPAFKAANISGELFGVLLPALGSLAPLVGAKSDTESLLDVDAAVAAKAFAQGASALSGNKVEYMLKMLLIQHGNISFERAGQKKDGTPQKLTEDEANDLFSGDVHDMFLLAWEVVKLNYGGFFGKLGSLFGDQADALRNLLKKAAPGQTNTETSTPASFLRLS